MDTDHQLPTLKKLHIYTELTGSEDANIDFAIELSDGRIFSMTAFTPANILRLMNEEYPEALEWIERGNVIVRRIDEVCLRAAAEKCIALGIEAFGVLARRE